MFRLEEIELEDPGPDEVIVRLEAAGICHTDLAVREGYFPIPSLPVVLGHEGAGVVVKGRQRSDARGPGRPRRDEFSVVRQLRELRVRSGLFLR